MKFKNRVSVTSYNVLTYLKRSIIKLSLDFQCHLFWPRDISLLVDNDGHKYLQLFMRQGENPRRHSQNVDEETKSSLLPR